MVYRNTHNKILFLATLIFTLVCFNVSAEAKETKEKQGSESTQNKSAQEKSKTKSKKDTDKKAAKKASQKKSTQKKKEAKDPSVVKIKADDPKAFTKAILYEKEGIEFEIVGEKKPTTKQSKKKEDDKYLDFSKMLVPITHEAPLGSKYGIRDHRLHRGVDVSVITDEPVVASLPGKVITSKFNKGGYGNYVLIEHENGVQTLYGHLSERAVEVGNYVYPGDIVGLAGNTGKSSAAHLHFEIRYGDINIDPETIIDFPKWKLKKGVNKISKKKITASHENLQKKLKKENTYVIHKGETLEDAATWFNISVEALCRINNLKPGAKLRVGQKLHGSK